MSASRGAQGSNIRGLHVKVGNVELVVGSRTCNWLTARRSGSLRGRLRGASGPRQSPPHVHPPLSEAYTMYAISQRAPTLTRTETPPLREKQLPQVKFLPSNWFLFSAALKTNTEHMENSHISAKETDLTHVSVV